jgi:hypothetical protein
MAHSGPSIWNKGLACAEGGAPHHRVRMGGVSGGGWTRAHIRGKGILWMQLPTPRHRVGGTGQWGHSLGNEEKCWELIQASGPHHHHKPKPEVSCSFCPQPPWAGQVRTRLAVWTPPGLLRSLGAQMRTRGCPAAAALQNGDGKSPWGNSGRLKVIRFPLSHFQKCN